MFAAKQLFRRNLGNIRLIYWPPMPRGGLTEPLKLDEDAAHILVGLLHRPTVLGRLGVAVRLGLLCGNRYVERGLTDQNAKRDRRESGTFVECYEIIP